MHSSHVFFHDVFVTKSIQAFGALKILLVFVMFSVNLRRDLFSIFRLLSFFSLRDIYQIKSCPLARVLARVIRQRRFQSCSNSMLSSYILKIVMLFVMLSIYIFGVFLNVFEVKRDLSSI